MRYIGPKARLCRREGINLFGSSKYQKLLQRNSNIPGMHGGRRVGKLTEFGRQLREKQKAKRTFGLSERQFKNYFSRASCAQGVTGDIFRRLLEQRLDNVLYRAGFALTRAQARQFASHGLFLVNGRRVDVPSFEIRVGDKIILRASRQNSLVFAKNIEELSQYQAPSWLFVDMKKKEVEILELPSPQHFEQFFDPQLIVEFYSR